METINETFAHILVNVGVIRYFVGPRCELCSVGKFAIEKQVRNF